MKASKNFTYTENNQEYIIQLKRKNYWWLLLFLLLLLPLILLIKFHKDISFNLVDEASQTGIPNSNVQFSYTYHSLLGSKPVVLNDSTNQNALVTFKNVEYTLYALWFHNSEECFVIAGNECSYADSLQLKFHKLKDKEITLVKLPPRAYDAEFNVINKDNNEPIPNAKIQIITKFLGKEKKWDDSTDVAGNYTVKNAPYCGTIQIIASKYGYTNDTISEKLDRLFNKANDRVLKLKPLKQQLTIFVCDLYTKKPLPGATATLKIEGKTVSTMQTNTNGVGEGQFADVPVLANITILVQKAYYHDTSKTTQAQIILKADKAGRTFYLRPDKQNISFRNLDAKTGLPIVGVKNEITVNGSLRPNAEYSNADGSFIVTGVLPEDVISINATKTGYDGNNTKIQNRKFIDLKNASQADRDIPLNAKVITPPKKDDEFKGESGDLRINLQWNSFDDLDLHVYDPCGNHLYALELSHTCNGGNGTLDIDANTNRYPESTWTKKPQENAFWNTPAKGTYIIKVEHCNKQDQEIPDPIRFNVTIIYKGVRKDFQGTVRTKNIVKVTEFVVD